MSDHSRITAVRPTSAIEGGRITIEGSGFAVDALRLPEVRIGDERARVVFASPTAIGAIVPSLADGGPTSVRIDGVPGETAFIDVAAPLATGLHMVDNPVFDRDSNLYVTYSGTRGQEVPVSIFRVRPNGTRETFSSGIVNPTSMAIDPTGRLYVSSRFEGTVYRVAADGTSTPFAADLGVACGLAFAPDGTLFVGDRSGTIFRVDCDGRAEQHAALPASVAAFHLALAPDGALHVTAPTLSSYDAVYRSSPAAMSPCAMRDSAVHRVSPSTRTGPFSWSTRSPASAAVSSGGRRCTGARADRSRPRRRRLRFRRRPRGLLERNRVPPGEVRLKADAESYRPDRRSTSSCPATRFPL